MKKIVVDASAILAVITHEQHRAGLLAVTENAELVAPASLPWEIGNALSAMFKRSRIDLAQAQRIRASYHQIPIQLAEVSLEEAVALAYELGVYAYDAYMLVCARNHRAPLLTLDRGLRKAAEDSDIEIVELAL